MEALKNKLWVFGHPTNSLKGVFGITGDSDVEAIASLKDFGAENLFFVPMGRPISREEKNEEMKNVAKTGWSIDSMQDALDIIEHKKRWPNLAIGLYDDFFSETNPDANYTNYSIKDMIKIRDSFHEAGLEMWGVFYAMQTEPGAWIDYLKIFDGVTFWFWNEPTKEEFDEKCRFFFDHTKGQKRMIGCYLYNLGDEKEAKPEMVRYQLDRELEFMKQGEIDGIIMHTNVFGGLGYAAYDEGVNWCREHCEDLV